MNLSYWELKSWFSDVDYAIVGSGIVGLSCAIQLKSTQPNAKVLIIERGMLPQGASTKNAGFACFGSLSEILSDLEHHSAEDVMQLIKKRVQGLKFLRETLGDDVIDYQNNGGYELFSSLDVLLYEKCLSQLDTINKLLLPIFLSPVFKLADNVFNFKNIQQKLILNICESQIDTGKMMEALLRRALSLGVKILNNATVQDFSDDARQVKIKFNDLTFSVKNLLIATNGFSAQLGIPGVRPARAQVLITKPIENLHIKGTFHLEEGYYYFRNIHDRILLGGGRNLDFRGEETTIMEPTALIQNKLEDLLQSVILPDTPFEIDLRWSGIMGVGQRKKAIVRQISNHVFCGVRMGGMGVAIGSLVGRELGDMSLKR